MEDKYVIPIMEQSAAITPARGKKFFFFFNLTDFFFTNIETRALNCVKISHRNGQNDTVDEVDELEKLRYETHLMSNYIRQKLKTSKEPISKLMNGDDLQIKSMTTRSSFTLECRGEFIVN